MGSPFEQSGETIEQKEKALSGKEKFEIVLNLFGSEAAKEAFLEACERYTEE
jgi:hypothetical protein